MNERRRTIRDGGAIGALERAGNEGFFSDSVRQNFVAEILAHLALGVGDAVGVVLGRDHGERVGLVAMALEIASGDLTEHAGKAALDLAIPPLGQIGSLEKIAADLLARRRRHLSDADHEYDLRALGLDRLHRLLHGGGAGGAGILDAGRGLEAQGIIGLEHEGGGEILGAEAGIEMAEHDLVDITASMPAWAIASRVTRTTMLSTVSVSCLPKGIWAQPTMVAVIDVISPGQTCLTQCGLRAREGQAGASRCGRCAA